MVDFAYENNKRKMQILITGRNDIRPLLGLGLLKNINLTIGNIRLDEDNQYLRQIIEKLRDLFKNNTTIKVAEIDIQLKPVTQYPVKQKARPIPLHLQEAVGTEIEKITKFGHSERVTSRRRLLCITGGNNGKEQQIGKNSLRLTKTGQQLR